MFWRSMYKFTTPHGRFHTRSSRKSSWKKSGSRCDEIAADAEQPTGLLAAVRRGRRGRGDGVDRQLAEVLIVRGRGDLLVVADDRLHRRRELGGRGAEHHAIAEDRIEIGDERWFVI